MRPWLTISALLLILTMSQTLSSANPTSASHSIPWYSALLSSPVITASLLKQATLQQVSSPTTSDALVSLDSSQMPQNEPSISINPLNSSIIVAGANDYRLEASGGLPWLGVYTSQDSGKSWSSQLIPGFPSDDNPSTLKGFDSASDPGLAFDGEGSLYYSGIVFDLSFSGTVDGSVFVAKSTDNGSNFSRITLAAPGNSLVFNDKPYVAVDITQGVFRGTVYVSWTQFTSTAADIMVSHSSDGGTTFSTPFKVSTARTNQGSIPVVGPGGELYVAWDDLVNDRIMITKSTDGGVSFSPAQWVSSFVPLPSTLPHSFFRVNSFPAATVDPSDGTVYLAWADYRNGNADILSSRSMDAGSSWSPPVKVNDDNTSNDQFFPWLSATPGRVSIAFYDRRLDPGNHLMDIFYTESHIGGPFSLNLRVTDVSSNPDAFMVARRTSFIGDYIGLARDATSSHVVWTDMRNISPSSPDNQDIFTDEIAINPPVIEPIGNKTIDEDTSLAFDVRATDPDEGETLTLTASNLPQGAEFNTSPSTNGTVTGLFSWTPSESQGPGNYSIRIIASDGTQTDTMNVTITVNEANGAPILSTPSSQTVDEEQALTFTVAASDPDIPPNTFTLSISSQPSGSSFNPTTGLFSWTPSEAQGPGDYPIIFTASDNGTPSKSTTKTVDVHVNEVNEPPILEVPAVQTVDEQTLLLFTVTAQDPDIPSSLLTLTCDSCTSLGADFNPATGSFSWTPSEQQGPGDYTFTFTVSDHGTPSMSDTKTVQVHVNEVESPPLINAQTQYDTNIGNTLRFTVRATDPDSPPAGLTLTASGLVEGMNFNSETGELSFTPSNNQAGKTFTIQFTATKDGATHLTTTKDVTITVGGGGTTQNPAAPLSEADLARFIAVAFVAAAASVLLFWRLRKNPETAV